MYNALNKYLSRRSAKEIFLGLNTTYFKAMSCELISCFSTKSSVVARDEMNFLHRRINIYLFDNYLETFIWFLKLKVLPPVSVAVCIFLHKSCF